MRALTGLSGGLCLLCDSYEEGLQLFEREAVHSLKARAPNAKVIVLAKGKKVEDYEKEIPYSRNPETIVPAWAKDEKSPRVSVVISAEAQKRLMREISTLTKDEPVEGVKIVPRDDCLAFWRIFMRAPEDSPYAGMEFVLYADLSTGYPESPPDIRFLTTIFHVQVSDAGRICHESLSHLSWTDRTTMRDVLVSIRRMLTNHNVLNAVDTNKGTLFREQRQQYFQFCRTKSGDNNK